MTGSNQISWRPRNRIDRTRIPDSIRALLFSPGSLTELLQCRCAHTLQVRLLGQRWARPLPEEQRLLQLAAGRYMLIREVRLDCGGKPWVYARTLLPASARHGEARRLTTMGDRPLGELLFHPPFISRLRREQRDFGRVSAGSDLYRALCRAQADAPPDTWARRSVYHLSGLQLGIIEIFLPGITESA